MATLSTSCAAPINKGRLPCALFSGAVAVSINMAILFIAKVIGIDTGNGVLIQIGHLYFENIFYSVGLPEFWSAIGLPRVGSLSFLLIFHGAVGLLMALFYAFILDDALRYRPLTKGILYAAAVWVINAFVALPLAGNGIAGLSSLTIGGILYFAFAHTVFFVLLALLYAHCHSPPVKTIPEPTGH